MKRLSTLIVSLLITSMTIVTFAQTPQTQGQSTTQQTNQKPLSTNEDPTMIGKRNINKGIWAGGILGAKGIETEVRLGKQLEAEIAKDPTVKFVTDPIITEYVNRVWQNIWIHSDNKIPLTTHVIDSDEVNAFALPGGQCYVNKGLLLAADNEAEVAGVFAHESAHVAARHGMENEAKMAAIQKGLMAAVIFGGPVGSTVARQGGGLFEGLSFLKFSRSAEEEADKLGVQYMWAAGYDPSAMATMFEKLEAKNKKKPGFFGKLILSHPMPTDRRASAIALAARFPERDEYVISSSEFQRVKARMLRLTNARVTGNAIPGPTDNNGTPGAPQLKRRPPNPDDPSATTDDGNQKPADKKPEKPPELKRQGAPPQSSPTPTPQQ